MKTITLMQSYMSLTNTYKLMHKSYKILYKICIVERLVSA